MAREANEPDYSDDEIEQILGMGIPDTRFALKEIHQMMTENPLLFAGLVFAFGVLVGTGLGRAHKKS
jgi:hypothetical protein